MSTPVPDPPPRRRAYSGVITVSSFALLAGIAVYFLAFQSLVLASILPALAIVISLTATSIVTRIHDAQLKNLITAVVEDPQDPDLRDELEEKLLTLPLYEIAQKLQLMDQSGGIESERFAAQIRRGRGPMRDRIRQSIAEVLEPEGRD